MPIYGSALSPGGSYQISSLDTLLTPRLSCPLYGLSSSLFILSLLGFLSPLLFPMSLKLSVSLKLNVCLSLPWVFNTGQVYYCKFLNGKHMFSVRNNHAWTRYLSRIYEDVKNFKYILIERCSHVWSVLRLDFILSPKHACFGLRT